MSHRQVYDCFPLHARTTMLSFLLLQTFCSWISPGVLSRFISLSVFSVLLLFAFLSFLSSLDSLSVSLSFCLRVYKGPACSSKDRHNETRNRFSACFLLLQVAPSRTVFVVLQILHGHLDKLCACWFDAHAGLS